MVGCSRPGSRGRILLKQLWGPPNQFACWQGYPFRTHPSQMPRTASHPFAWYLASFAVATTDRLLGIQTVLGWLSIHLLHSNHQAHQRHCFAREGPGMTSNPRASVLANFGKSGACMAGELEQNPCLEWGTAFPLADGTRIDH